MPPQTPPRPSPWFEGAPITKAMCIIWVVSHVVWPPRRDTGDAGISTAVAAFSILSKLRFATTGSLIRGLACLGHGLKSMERELSSRQLIAWMFWNFIGVTAMETMLLVTTAVDFDARSSSSALMGRAMGPFFLVGGLLQWYWQFVPRLHPRFVSFAGLSMSEKTLPYAGILYVMMDQGLASVVATAMGAATSALYFLLPPGARKTICNLLVPDWLIALGPWDLLGGLLFLDPPPQIYAPLMMAVPTAGERAARRQPATPRATPVPSPPPSQEAIDQLTAMGFDEERVKQALQQTANNVERAADRLLTG